MFGQNMNGGLPLMLEGYIDEINDFLNQIIMFINYLWVLVNYLNKIQNEWDISSLTMLEETQKILRGTPRCLQSYSVTGRLLLDLLNDNIHLFFNYCDVKRIIRGSP